MKVLIGTTNPSKVKRFEELLGGHDVEFFTLNDLGIEAEPEEMGKTPEENAVIKAKFYGQFFDKVICNDSGLYLDDLPLDSISLNRNTLTYFVEKGNDKYDTAEENVMIGAYRGRLVKFLEEALGIIRES